MLNLSLKELKTESKNRSIKGLKGMSIDKLLGILDKLEPVKKTQDIRGIRKKPYKQKKLFRLEKRRDYENIASGDKRNLFRLEKDKDKQDRALGDIRNLFRSKRTKALKIAY